MTALPNEGGRVPENIPVPIAAAILPDRAPDRLWGGPGSGLTCELCGKPVTGAQIEFELEFASGDSGYRVHSQCFDAWDTARMQRAIATRAGSGKRGQDLTDAPPCGTVPGRDGRTIPEAGSGEGSTTNPR